jgi:hypothetical protein
MSPGLRVGVGPLVQRRRARHLSQPRRQVAGRRATYELRSPPPGVDKPRCLSRRRSPHLSGTTRLCRGPGTTVRVLGVGQVLLVEAASVGMEAGQDQHPHFPAHGPSPSCPGALWFSDQGGVRRTAVRAWTRGTVGWHGGTRARHAFRADSAADLRAVRTRPGRLQETANPTPAHSGAVHGGKSDDLDVAVHATGGGGIPCLQRSSVAACHQARGPRTGRCWREPADPGTCHLGPGRRTLGGQPA